MDQKTIDTYNKLAIEYDEETSDFWERFPRKIIQEFSNLVNGKVLDIGSGPGRDGILLKEAGLDVVCIDASVKMVELAREKGLNAIEGNFMSLPFEDEKFNGVWAYTSLLHVSKKEVGQALSEINRVLRAGGVLGLGLIEGEGELYKESSGVNMPRWFSFYTKEEVQNLLSEHGFKEVFFDIFKPKTKNYLNFIAIKN